MEITIAAPTERDTRYGIVGRSEYVYRVGGKGLHNPFFPHRVVVWDNTRRPNPRNGESVSWGDYGPIDGGEGQYLDPTNKATDVPITILLTSESTAICADTSRNTGQPGSGQVYADRILRLDDIVTLIAADGATIGEYIITARFLADPILLEV